MKPGFGDWETPLCGCEDKRHAHPSHVIFHYDTDWEATGPLIEKYHVNVVHVDRVVEIDGTTEGAWWSAMWDERPPLFLEASGTTPLIAICQLILQLKEAGKL
jgi:hypothetical protein